VLITLAPLRYSATYIHADAPALGCAGMAYWFLSQRRPTGWMNGCAAGLCAWLSVWSKQTMILLPALLPAWVWWTEEVRAGRAMLVFTVATGTLVGAACWIGWGGDPWYFNAVPWPGHLPWKGSAPANLLNALWELAGYAMPFGVLLIAACRHRGTRRIDFAEAAALLLVPMSVLGRVKRGGDLNSFSPTLYMLLLACTARLRSVQVSADDSSPDHFARAWRQLVAASLLGITALGVPWVVQEANVYDRLRSANAETNYLRTFPGRVYFPWHPLAHLAAEGRLTHHAHSVRERGVAGFPVQPTHVRSGLPERAEYVAFPLKRLGPVVGFGWSFELLQNERLLPEGAEPIRLAGLPDYECYRLVRR
jgi:hypothetical protein